MHDFYYAFRNDPRLKNRVTAIAESSSNADMIQDLNDLSVLGKANTALLEAIHFDLTTLDTAATTANEMADILSQATIGKADNSASRVTRDKAYTYLKQAVRLRPICILARRRKTAGLCKQVF